MQDSTSMARGTPAGSVVLVTGSSGFIGTAVSKRLLRDGYSVVGFDVEPPRDRSEVTRFLEVDLTSDESVTGALAEVKDRFGGRIASVIHLAAFYDFSGESNPMYEELTVGGTERLLRNLLPFTVEQFAFSSTQLVYAPSEPGQRINEDWPLEPKWPYPESKVRAEEAIRRERGGIPVVLMRMTGVYTDRCHQPTLAHQIQRIYERQVTAHLFPGSTAHGQPLMHLDDLVEAVARIVDRRADLAAETVLLLGEPETMSYDALQHTLARLIHDEDWETRQIPKAVAKTGAWMEGLLPGDEPFIRPWMVDMADDHWELDISRARTLLGWEPRRSLRETLPKMVAFLKEDPLGFYRENKLTPPGRLEEREREPGNPEEGAEEARAGSGASHGA